MSLRLNYFGLADHTGYACAAVQYVRALTSKSAEVHFQPMGPGPGLGLAYECKPQTAVPFALRDCVVASLFRDADCILHTVPEYYPRLTAWLRERGVRGRILGMTVWETSRLPRHWPVLLQALDGVIVPSTWNRSIFEQSGVTVPMHVLPHLSEFNGKRPCPKDDARLHRRLPDLSGKFVFYSIADWNRRKGNDVLLRAFMQAFAGRTDVALVLKTKPSALKPVSGYTRLLDRLKGRVNPLQEALATNSPLTVVVTDDLSSDEMAALHELGDCYVSCTHGEGWGMGLFEAAFYGRPVIAPTLGGHRTYLQPESLSGLVPARYVPVSEERGDRSYTRDQTWVEVDVGDVMLAMQRVFAAPASARSEAINLAERLRAEYTAESIVHAMSKILIKSS